MKLPRLIIADALKEYHKEKKHEFIGTIYLSNPDYTYLLANDSELGVATNSSKTIFGLELYPMSDTDIAWMGIEFTGWKKDNPELLQFIENIYFRELLYGKPHV